MDGLSVRNCLYSPRVVLDIHGRLELIKLAIGDLSFVKLIARLKNLRFVRFDCNDGKRESVLFRFQPQI